MDNIIVCVAHCVIFKHKSYVRGKNNTRVVFWLSICSSPSSEIQWNQPVEYVVYGVYDASTLTYSLRVFSISFVMYPA